MTIELSLDRLTAKLAVVVEALAICALLGYAMLTSFIVGILTDERVAVSRDHLASGIGYVPNAAAVQARLAQAEMMESERDLASVEAHALRAVNMSPWDYNNHLLLASVRETRGDRAAAEMSLLDALALAPNHTDVRWRYANLLVRQGKVAQSLDEFRKVTSSNISLLPSTLDLIWQASGADLNALEAVTSDDPKARLRLAQFLFKQSRFTRAASLFKSIDRNARLAIADSSDFINAFIAKGYLDLARDLWMDLVSDSDPKSPAPAANGFLESPLIWNGSFESDISDSFAQFDWVLKTSEYARPRIDDGTARLGGRSLRIDFTGRDTTRLDGQIKQLIIVRPGARYRLVCYAKAEKLVTPEGPRVVVADSSSQSEIASSMPVAPGSSDWQQLVIDFVAPPSVRALSITVKRIPRFSYDDPSRGTVWVDDFLLTRQDQSK